MKPPLNKRISGDTRALRPKSSKPKPKPAASTVVVEPKAEKEPIKEEPQTNTDKLTPVVKDVPPQKARGKSGDSVKSQNTKTPEERANMGKKISVMNIAAGAPNAETSKACVIL